MHQSSVIGYFAVDGDHLLLDNDACIVTGDPATMQGLVDNLPVTAKVTANGIALDFRVRKIRFGAIVDGMQAGGCYAFDEVSYRVFRELANSTGFDLPAEQFQASTQEGIPLVRVRLSG